MPSALEGGKVDSIEGEKLGVDDSPIPDVDIDPEAERRLLKKLDWILLPLFTMIYCCNFIDRTSIGNARVAGLETDLGMTGFDLNIALTTFYIAYISADIPSNLLLKQWGSNWLAFLVLGFGAVSIGAAFVQNYAGLIVTRVFLGLAEGGTLSALVYIISRYYRRSELVLRVGIFFGTSPSIAGAFGGLLASGLLRVPDFGMVKTWRKIFLIEGIITTVFGLVLLLIVPEDPSKSKILNAAERKLALARIDADQVIKTQGKKEKTTLKLVLRSFNFITIACIICYIMVNMSFQGMSLFMPSVIRTQGNYTTIEVQLRTVPPYVASAFWVILNAWISARIKMRSVPLFCNALIMAVGYIISVTTKNSKARYAACFLIMMGASVCGPMIMTWGTDNAAPDTVRAVVTGAIPGFGAVGAILAVWTYAPTDAPDYRKGNLANLAAISAVCLLVVATAIYIWDENRKRGRGDRDGRLEGKTEKELADLGCYHPQFRYQI
ncbi:major facilitator superfamily domain-containing protein [Ephemerocybe angulata]|uniref:Major facilitator superfamily domain-containing protein n=1 Tax=Ephemerocybe angulata TaxID=980116 RepID=A0A8H6HEW8_9AGAR|nr:major facilitator superfamily domain-containing protein [Tulosesus angulatus]